MSFGTCLLMALTLHMPSSGSNPQYAYQDLPGNLIEAALAVVRRDDQQLFIEQNGDISHKRVFAITILEENGEDLATFYGQYDKYRRLKSVTGRIYNQEGKLEETLRGEDILDVSNISSFSLYEDNRVKIVDPEYHSYPYTVEYTVNYVLRSFLDIPDWKIYPAYNVAVQESSFEVTSPDKGAFRYSFRKLDLEPEIEQTSKGYCYRWHVEACPALIQESVSRGITDISPVLYIGPNDFNYAGHPGKMSTWNEFGKWIYSLGEDKRDLSEEETAHIRDLAASAGSTREKISVLYQYMQNKVRYVNISLGIGGYEPVPASQVSEVGYGDCKALTNYMMAILEVAGIPSFYTLVKGGSQPSVFLEDFPSQQFNHVILAVPQPEDTVWLECTSQRYPAGYLGSFTDDRPVLIVTSEGGVLARTPGFRPEENRIITSAQCILDENGNSRISISKAYGGIYFGSKLYEVHNNDRVEQTRQIQKGLRFASFTVEDFRYATSRDPFLCLEEEVTLSAQALLGQGLEQIPLVVGQLSEEVGLPSRSRNRKYPIHLRRGSTIVDTVTYVLPDRFEVQYIPDPVELNTPFGKYSMTIKTGTNEIRYIRQVRLNAGEYDPEQFNDFYRFLRNIRTADQKKVMLVKT